MSPDTSAWWPLIREMAGRYGADAKLLECIMARESGGKATAIGPVNRNGTRDYGLFQLNPKGALDAWYANGHRRVDPMDPRDNAEVAAWFVGKCIPVQLREIGAPLTVRNVCVAYNAGSGAVKSGKVPASTEQYVAWVAARYARSTFAADDLAVPVVTPRAGKSDPKLITWLGSAVVGLSALWGAVRLLWKGD